MNLQVAKTLKTIIHIVGTIIFIAAFALIIEPETFFSMLPSGIAEPLKQDQSLLFKLLIGAVFIEVIFSLILTRTIKKNEAAHQIQSPVNILSDSNG